MDYGFLEFFIGLLRVANPFRLLRSANRRELLNKWRQASISERLAYSVLMLTALTSYGLAGSLVVIMLMAANKFG